MPENKVAMVVVMALNSKFGLVKLQPMDIYPIYLFKERPK
jgi:hypothetical protein